METAVPLMVAVPLGAAFAVVAMAHLKGLRRLTGALSLVAVLVDLALALAFLTRSVDPVFIGGWGPGRALGIELVCDGLAKMMLVIINLVALVSVLYARAYMRRFTQVWLFDCLFLLMTGAMNGVVLAGDLFNLFVFLEVAAIASYALVGFGCESEELEAALKYLVLGTIGSAFILLGVTVLYSMTGHLNMARVAQVLAGLERGNPAVLLAAAALMGGLALKAAMVPFHAWLPDAHPSAPAPISAMLSGVLIKASGVYALARIVFNVLGPGRPYADVLIVLGAVSMVVGVFLAVGQWDFKRLLAYHSISQMGYVVLAIGVAADLMGEPSPRVSLAGLCLFGGLFHLFNHAMFKSLLFLSSGAVEQQAHTRMLKELGGLTRRMPVTSFCCRVGALSIAGVPPFNGFFSKFIIILSLGMAGRWVVASLAVLAALMTLLSFVKVQRYALEGEPSQRMASVKEAPLAMCTGMIVLALACCVGGLAMMPLRRHLFDPASRALTKEISPSPPESVVAMGAQQ
jgi:multicomponent Na+:H+ antiporter subunit D